VACAGELAHVDPDLRHQVLGGSLVQPRDRRQLQDLLGERGHRLLDSTTHLGDERFEGIELVHQQAQLEPMVLGHLPLSARSPSPPSPAGARGSSS
jgi:hypothetical protein